MKSKENIGQIALICMILGLITFIFLNKISAIEPCKAKKSVTGQNNSAPVALNEDITFVKDNWIYLLKHGTMTPIRLIKGTSPSLSPDGLTLIHSGVINYRNSGVYSYNTQTKVIKSLLSGNQPVSGVYLSPNGKLIAYNYYDSADILCIINADGSNNRVILNSEAKSVDGIYGLNWAKDSESLYFHDMSKLYQINLSGNIINTESLEAITGNLNSITSSDRFSVNPVNDNEILFTTSVDGTPKFEARYHEPNTALFMYNGSNGSKKRLTPVNLLAIDPAWSRDGQYIYFTGFYDYQTENNPFKLFRIGADGSNLVEITRGEQVSN